MAIKSQNKKNEFSFLIIDGRAENSNVNRYINPYAIISLNTTEKVDS